jgi:hypothetical protein
MNLHMAVHAFLSLVDVIPSIEGGFDPSPI